MTRLTITVILAAMPLTAAASDIAFFVPRNGVIQLDGDPTPGLSILATDVDEDISSLPLTTPFFNVGDLISQAPNGLDAGDYAYAVAILDESGPVAEVTSYFQIRLAGSSATIQDTSLVPFAIAAGLWTSVDDYIEFQPQFALVTPGDSPTGPSDFSQSILPEPTSLVLMLLVCISRLLTLRTAIG